MCSTAPEICCHGSSDRSFLATDVDKVTMVNLSLAGIIVAVVAVVVAYFLGYANGVSLGRDEGYSDGKRDGTREGSIRAYAIGYDRGKHNRESDDDDEDDDEDDDGSDRSSWGQLIVAVTAAMLVLLWLSSKSNTPSTGNVDSQAKSEMSRRYPTATPDSVANDTVSLPRLNRSLPTASPVPSAPHLRRNPVNKEAGARSFPHPPPAFGQPRQ